MLALIPCLVILGAIRNPAAIHFVWVELPQVLLLAGFFLSPLALGIYLVGESFRVLIVIAPEGVCARSPWRRRRLIGWDEVVAVSYSHFWNWFVITGRDRRKVRAHVYLNGLTWDAVVERRSRFLEPGRVLQNVLWPAAVDVARTEDFREQRHDPLVSRLQEILEARLLERPRMSILQSLQDRGVDLLIEWPHRAKYGVQLKNHGDVEDKDFAPHTLMQIQDSRQHGLERLYVVITADIREVRKGKSLDNANSQKVRGLISRISAMNDPYVVVVPPERAWTLLLVT